MKKILLLLLMAACACATTLTGSIKNPDGSGATGTLLLSLSQPGALSPAGSCGGPVEIVPNYQVRITVTAGSLVSPPSIYGNDCILPQGTYYNVSFLDNRGNIVFVDRWILTGTSVDVGTIVSVVVSGLTTTLGSVGVVFTTPSGDQTVNQPVGSTLHVNTLDVTAKLTGPGGMNCLNTFGQCTFATVVAFPQGIGTGPTSSSEIFIGNGNFYDRYYLGNENCAGVVNGWMGVMTSTSNGQVTGNAPAAIRVCIGGVSYEAPLVTRP